VLTAEQIAARLDDRLRLLTSGDRTAPPRQQTLRATLDWSWELLTKPEQALLRRLSVFAGGCDINAMETVCTDSEQAGEAGVVPSDAIVDLLTYLTDKSLVVIEHLGGAVRYRLLETVRQYAAERLEASGELTATRRRHADLFLALTHDIHQSSSADPSDRSSFARLDAEHGNLRVALAWYAESRDGEASLALASHLGDFWDMHGLCAEGRQWLERLLTEPKTQCLPRCARRRWPL
jgi:predicted ATPase